MIKHPKVVISSGHGLSSRTPGEWDSGAPPGEAKKVFDLATRVVSNLRALEYRGMKADHRARGYYSQADDDALKFFDGAPAAQCLFVEYHLDSSPNDTAHGTGMFLGLEPSNDEKRAAAIHLERVTEAIHTTSRGVRREAFAVLKAHPMVSLLAELYFVSNAGDREKAAKYDTALELALTNSVLEWAGWTTVSTRPRKWGPIRRSLYKPY